MMAENFDPETGEIVVPPMPPAVSAAIIAVAKQITMLGTDDKNDHGGYKFVSVDKFYERIGKLMADAGLAVMADEIASEVREGAKGNAWLFMRYSLAFVHASGAMSPPMRRSCALPISGPQAFGAAQSYIEKQFLRQVFKVPTGERDADDTAQTDQPPGRPAAASQAAQQTSAPASAARAEATKRWREMRDAIDQATMVPEIDQILASPAWSAMVEHIKRDSPEKVEGVVAHLRERADNRKTLLAAPPETENYDDR